MSETAGENVEHYFSASPAGEFRTSEVAVTLAGQDFTVETSGGIFSPDHVDAGTEALLRTVDSPAQSGNLLDIGCGWGPIALSLALEAPEAQVYAVDVNERALELTRRNVARVGASNVHVSTPETVDPSLTFDTIWSNPPIRVGKDVLHGLMLHWLPRLNVDADAYLVVQKNLGADSLHRWLEAELPSNFSTIRVDSAKSFRVLRVRNRG